MTQDHGQLQVCQIAAVGRAAHHSLAVVRIPVGWALWVLDSRSEGPTDSLEEHQVADMSRACDRLRAVVRSDARGHPKPAVLGAS